MTIFIVIEVLNLELGTVTVKPSNLTNHGLSFDLNVYDRQHPVIFTFLWRAKKSNKRNPALVLSFH